MVVINDVNSQKFTFNGIEYFKNFTPVVIGDKVRILNAYDSAIELTSNPTLFSDFVVDGNTFLTVAALQTALLPVLYTRSTLGGGSTNWAGLTNFNSLTDATTPLAGTEDIAIVQGGETKKVAVSEFIYTTDGKSYESLSSAMAVIPLPENNTIFYIDESNLTEKGLYAYDSSEASGYRFVRDYTPNGIVEQANTKAVSGGEVYEKIKEKITNDDLSDFELINKEEIITSKIVPLPFTKYVGGGTLDTRTKEAWYRGTSTKTINTIFVPLTSVYNGSVALTDSVYVRIALNSTFILSKEITLSDMALQGIDTTAGTEDKSMYRIDLEDFDVNLNDIIYVGLMCKSPTDKLGFVATSSLSNEWVNGYLRRGTTDINSLVTPPATVSNGLFAMNIYFKFSEFNYDTYLPQEVQELRNDVDQIEVDLENKVDVKFNNTSTFNNSNVLNATYPFWQKNNTSANFRFVQFNITAENRTFINSIKIAGAYIEDVNLVLGSGNLSLRIYKGITINSNKSNFTGAELIRKSIVSVADFFANSTKAPTDAELKTKLFSGDIGFTDFNFDLLEIAKGETLYFYFGVDDDEYYTNTPKLTNPTTKMSILAGLDSLFTVFNPYLKNDFNSTFLAGTPEALFISSDTFPVVILNTVEEEKYWNNGYVDIKTRNINTFVGAMNKVLDELYLAKPDARVVMIGHNTLAGTANQSQQHFKKLVEVQQMLADYWGCHYLPLWKHLNWVKNENTNTFTYWCPDSIHPYSNPNKVTTSIGLISESDYNISRFVKDWIYPIYGENWAGKKVATYGTSIPYGGKYSMLAVDELGATPYNYCSSGSYLRRGNTLGVLQDNSFTNIASLTYRNYQKDMLDLIGTVNEPDLFIFDFGINDFNLDQTDFDITY